ncbi:MAG: hypothetical protein ABW167_05235 [Baekduia sp.]
MSRKHPPEQLVFAGTGVHADDVRKARIHLRNWIRDVAGFDEGQEREIMRSVRLAPNQPRDPWDFRLMGELPNGSTFTTLCSIP